MLTLSVSASVDPKYTVYKTNNEDVTIVKVATVLGPFWSVDEGSIVRKTCFGPFAKARAVRFAEKHYGI